MRGARVACHPGEHEGLHPKLGVGVGDVCGEHLGNHCDVFGGIDEMTGVAAARTRARIGVRLHAEAGDQAERKAAASAQAPVELWGLGRAGVHHRVVGQHDFVAEDVVDAGARRPADDRVSAAQEEAAERHGRAAPGAGLQLVFERERPDHVVRKR